MREKLQQLLDRVAKANEPSREIDDAINRHFRNSAGPGIFQPERMPTQAYYGPRITASVDAALALVARVLPDWWVSVALCSVSGDCSMAPDYNGPARERLLAEFPEDEMHEGFHADLRPGDGWHRACYAVLTCLLEALIFCEDQKSK